jgi:hypothetical protein
MTLFTRIILLAVSALAVNAAIPIAYSTDASMDTGVDNAAASMLLKRPSQLKSLPTRIPYGSIRIKHYDGDLTQFVSLATVTLDDAIRSTRRLLKEKITTVELTVATGYLVWRVVLVRDKGEGAVLMIDAGTGEFLALMPLLPTRLWWEF